MPLLHYEETKRLNESNFIVLIYKIYRDFIEQTRKNFIRANILIYL